MLKLDVFVNLSQLVRDTDKAVRVFPLFGWACRLNVRESVLGNVTVYRRPTQRQRPHPERETGNRSFHSQARSGAVARLSGEASVISAHSYHDENLVPLTVKRRP